MELTIEQLAEKLKAEIIADKNSRQIKIRAVSPVAAAKENEVTFITDSSFIPELKKCSAAAVISAEKIEKLPIAQLIVKNSQAALIKALKLFAAELDRYQPGIDKTAVIDDTAQIADTAYIGPYAVIEQSSRIGENTAILAGCKIGPDTVIGNNCRLESNVVVYHNCRIGNNVIIQANSTIGSAGFGYAFVDGRHQLIPHNGGVVIEDFVEIGANCAIDRAKLENTIIGAGTKIDNLVQIAHNVIIGKNCLIAALVGIAGSCNIGDNVVLGGQVGIADNVTIGSGVMVGGKSGVVGKVPPGKKLLGMPASDYKNTLKVFTIKKHLPKMAKQLKQLLKRVEKLEASKDNKN